MRNTARALIQVGTFSTCCIVLLQAFCFPNVNLVVKIRNTDDEEVYEKVAYEFKSRNFHLHLKLPRESKRS